MIDLNRFPAQEALGRKGVFYVGGQLAGAEGNHYWQGQMFVEAYIPKKVTHPWPLIFLHGAGQTNVNWLTTPDGRPGWADFFVQQGYVVYLAEQPARGRSAYHPDTDGKLMHHSAEALWNRFASNEGSWPQAELHTMWPDREQGSHSETFREFLRSQVEYLDSNKRSQELVQACMGQLLDATGPAILVTHSQAGPFGWNAADAWPELVKGIVALEPSGPPFGMKQEQSVSRDFGLGDLPLHYVPAVEHPDELRLSWLPAPAPGLKDGWVFAEPAPQLPTLRGIPIAIITSESSYHAGYDHLLSHILLQAGVPNSFLRLEEHGIHGNGHMMMLEKNHLEIAALVCDWLDNQSL